MLRLLKGYCFWANLVTPAGVRFRKHWDRLEILDREGKFSFFRQCIIEQSKSYHIDIRSYFGPESSFFCIRWLDVFNEARTLSLMSIQFVASRVSFGAKPAGKSSLQVDLIFVSLQFWRVGKRLVAHVARDRHLRGIRVNRHYVANLEKNTIQSSFWRFKLTIFHLWWSLCIINHQQPKVIKLFTTVMYLPSVSPLKA
jgi:hypothetical protein